MQLSQPTQHIPHDLVPSPPVNHLIAQVLLQRIPSAPLQHHEQLIALGVVGALEDGGEAGMADLCEPADLLEVGGDLARLVGTVEHQLHFNPILPPHCQIGGVFEVGLLVQTPQWLLLVEDVLLLDALHC